MSRPPNPSDNPRAWAPPPIAPWQPPTQVQVSDHQGLAISALVVSICSILGLVPAAVAMVQSSMVNSRLRRGDVPGAQVASGRARLWSWVAIAVSVVIYVIAYASGSNT